MKSVGAAGGSGIAGYGPKLADPAVVETLAPESWQSMQVIEAIQPTTSNKVRVLIRTDETRLRIDGLSGGTFCDDDSTYYSEFWYLVNHRGHGLEVGMRVDVTTNYLAKGDDSKLITPLETKCVRASDQSFQPLPVSFQETRYTDSLDAKDFYTKHPEKTVRMITAVEPIEHRREKVTIRATIYSAGVHYSGGEVRHVMGVRAREESYAVRKGTGLQPGYVRLAPRGREYSHKAYLFQ